MLGFSKTNIANVYVEVSSSLNLTKYVHLLVYSRNGDSYLFKTFIQYIQQYILANGV